MGSAVGVSFAEYELDKMDSKFVFVAAGGWVVVLGGIWGER